MASTADEPISRIIMHYTRLFIDLDTDHLAALVSPRRLWATGARAPSPPTVCFFGGGSLQCQTISDIQLQVLIVVYRVKIYWPIALSLFIA